MMAESDQTAPRKPRWRRFSLRAIVVLITILCGVAAWLAAQMEKAKHEYAIVKRYEQKAKEKAGHESLGYVYFSAYFSHESGSPNEKESKPKAPSFLTRMSSDNLFSPLEVVHIQSDEFAEILNEDLDFSSVKYLTLNSCFQLNNLDSIAQCKGLEILSIKHCGVTDFSGLKKLSNLKKIILHGLDDELYGQALKHLDRDINEIVLDDFGWTPSVVEQICEMKSLEKVDLRRRPAPLELAEQLDDALPQAQIIYELDVN